VRKCDIKIAYIGGGSRGWAWGFMKDLSLDGEISGDVRLYDIDRDAAKRNSLIGGRISAHPKAKSHWKYSVSESLKEALNGADFVVISILPGTFEEMRSDVHEPEKLGIYQPVGDTTGPGGLVRALRTIPMFTEIGGAIRDYCPNAWVINYTNPMALCVAALYATFPGIKAFGCCHEVFGTHSLLCDMLADMCGINGVTREQIMTNVLGVNHFTWFDKASYEDIGLFPVFAKFADKYYDTGYGYFNDKNWMNKAFKSTHRVKFDLFRRYGLIAAAGDRHLAEFMPPWYLKDPATVEYWGYYLTTVDRRIAGYNEKLAQSVRLAEGRETIELEPSGEEGHMLIKSILGLGNRVSNVNLPNIGQVANLPLGVIVETNALFARDSVSPVFAGNIPARVLGLVMPHAINQGNILQAAMECDYSLALTAFLADPLVNVSPQEAEALFKTMLENTKAFLPAEWGLYI
jgi:alpha-galactosidase